MLEPDSGAWMARRAVQALVRECVSEGVTYLQDKGTISKGSTSLQQLGTKSGRSIEAEIFVFSCGPWLPQLFPELLRERIVLSRQEVFFFGVASNPDLYSPPALPIWIDFKDEAYGFPDLDSRSVKVAIDRHGPPMEPDTDDRIVSISGLSEVRQYLSRRLPGLKNAPVLETRVCQYENTSNGDFLIDRHPDHDNVWLVGGGSGHGFKHGPTVGEYVVARISGNEQGIEPRFSLASKGTAQQRTVY